MEAYKDGEMQNRQDGQNHYHPEDDAYWYRNQIRPMKYKISKPWSTRKKVIFGITIGIWVLGNFCWGFYNMFYSNPKRFGYGYPQNNTFSSLPPKMQASFMSETMAVCTDISKAISKYQKRTGSIDLSGLDVPEGTARAGFVAGSPLFEKLNLDYDMLATQPNFDPEDYLIIFMNDGKDGIYMIVCDAAKGAGRGTTRMGPEAGIFYYDPFTQTMSTTPIFY